DATPPLCRARAFPRRASTGYQSLSRPLRQRGTALFPCAEGIAGGGVPRFGVAIPGIRAAAVERDRVGRQSRFATRRATYSSHRVQLRADPGGSVVSLLLSHFFLARRATKKLPLSLIDRRRAGGRAAVPCGLFIGVGEFDQLRLAPGPPEQLKADRQSVRSEA